MDNILAEKLRSLIERTKIRDYYDAWRLFEMEAADTGAVMETFFEKCKGKGIEFRSVDQFFRDDLMEILEPHLDELTRMTDESPPPLPVMINELRARLEAMIP